MAEAYTASFNFGDSLDDDSGIGTKSGSNSIKLDSEAQSVREWESESERSWLNESDEEDDDVLGEINIFVDNYIFYSLICFTMLLKLLLQCLYFTLQES